MTNSFVPGTLLVTRFPMRVYHEAHGSFVLHTGTPVMVVATLGNLYATMLTPEGPVEVNVTIDLHSWSLRPL